MKYFVGAAALLALAGVTVWFWDASPPTVAWRGTEVLGPSSDLQLSVADEGKGLRTISVELRQDGRAQTVYSRVYPVRWLPWQRAPAREDVVLGGADLEKNASLEEGPFELVTRVTDQANLWLFRRERVDTRSLPFDRTPPRIEVLSAQHNLRQGGSEAAVYRVSEEVTASGVRVGDRFFSGYPLTGQGAGARVCLFALAYDASLDVPIAAWAEDRAGNRAETSLGVQTFPRAFRERRIEVTDRLIADIAPEILSHTAVDEGKTPVETFIAINSALRGVTRQRIDAITTTSKPHILWKEPFQQLSNSQVESSFADRRSYFYRGEKIDEQTHLGFDLASLAHSAVEAANDGEVVFADYLGIYGNCVILDHGFGLFSLYGHLSRIDVERGQSVTKGETLGLTGQTGLAAGDHLHFSMLLQGVQVTPLEWWDPHWVQVHILSRIAPPEPPEGQVEEH